MKKCKCGEWMRFQSYKNLKEMSITKLKCPQCGKIKETRENTPRSQWENF